MCLDRESRLKMAVFGKSSSSLSLDLGSPEHALDDNEESTLSPGPLSFFLLLPCPLQGSPLVAQLTSTCSLNIIPSKTRKHKHPDNFFQGKAHTMYGISPKLDISLYSSEASFDGAQRCTQGCTEVLAHLAAVIKVIGRHNVKT